MARNKVLDSTVRGILLTSLPSVQLISFVPLKVTSSRSASAGKVVRLSASCMLTCRGY